jgi:hypothetical protein
LIGPGSPGILKLLTIIVGHYSKRKWLAIFFWSFCAPWNIFSLKMSLFSLDRTAREFDSAIRCAYAFVAAPRAIFTNLQAKKKIFGISAFQEKLSVT